MKRRPSLMLLLVIALMALLPLLAVFQYHWLGEVSRGERERMKGNLQASVAQLGQDFDREMKGIFLHFQGRLIPFGEEAAADLSERYRLWQSNSAHPRLIGEIYQIQATEAGNDGDDQLMRFVAASNRFEPSEWPDKLSGFRRFLAHQRKTRESAQMLFKGVLGQRGMMRIEGNGGASIIQLSIGPVDDQIPGLIIPLMPVTQPKADNAFALPIPRAYRVLALDQEYIKQEFIPELVKRYLSNDGKSDYLVSIVSRQDPQKVVYQSDPGQPVNAIGTSDVTDYFFKVRINEFDRMIIAGSPGQTNRGESNKSETARLSISVIQSDLKIFNKDGGIQSGQTTNSFIRMSNDGIWQVGVKHRAGSLEAAVAGLRRRNLAISFGILLLLGLSVGLIVLSSRRAQKLAAQQMEFVAGVSHELRTPLSVICSAAENLADGVIDNRDQIMRYGGLIRDEGRRLTGMVEQVLEFARVQSGRRSYDLRPSDLARVIDDALTACHLQMVEAGFEIEKNVPGDLPVVKADAAALSRAIQNLLNNAMKYSGQSRWVGLSAESVKTSEGEEVQIKISDRGFGIAPSEMPHIFEPFYRGREVTSAQIHGNGLGLSVVRHIIETHGGRVSVKSDPKQGTTFTLHLPVDPADGLSIDSAESAKENYEQAHFAR